MKERLRSLREWRGPASGRAAWLAVALLAADVVVSTWPTDFPNGSGVRYWIVWLAAGAIILAGASLATSRLRPALPHLRGLEALALLSLLAMVMSDVTMAWQPLRDLDIYLRAGRHFLDGSDAYSQSPLLVQPQDRSLYPFLYPPLTLPLFGALALLPRVLAQGVWLAVSLGLGLWAFRLFGLRRRWLPAAVLWPPLFQGLWVGNVAVPLLALFALAPWLGGGLVAAAVFKPYSGLAALWLVRERRWAGLLAGAAIVALLALATLPLTGTNAWSDWIGGLRAYGDSQSVLPALYGFGLMRFLPAIAVAAIGIVALVAASRPRGVESLARFGVATLVASPSTFGHGMLIAVPAVLSLRTLWAWLAIGLLSTPDGPQWWWAIILVAASWLLPALRRQDGETDMLDPLAGGEGAWPDARQAPGMV